MTSPVIAKIISMQTSLTVSENEIAQYVMNNTDTVVASTITAMAQNTGTSEASINRFCKKIGYKGFNSFKVALAQGTFYSTRQQSSVPQDGGLLASINQDYTQMLINTTALLDESQLLRAAQALSEAQHIYIFATATTALVARELEMRLGLVGLYAKAVCDPGEIRVFANHVTRSDFVILMAPTLLVQELYHAVTMCHDSGARLLSITSYDAPKLSDSIDFKFIISDKITTRYSVSISNNLMYLYVVDVLYCALLEGDRKLKRNRLNSDSILYSQQRSDNYFFEY